MPSFKDITGQRFGRLVAIGPHSRKHGMWYWLCRCDCGKQTTPTGGSLRSGRARSCGCWKSETSRLNGFANKTHGHTLGGHLSPTYLSWKAMMNRCQYPLHRAYKYYGGRGIKVCPRWHAFENFLADMGERPPGKTLDRYPDQDGDYEPANCRWATSVEQSRNKTPRPGPARPAGALKSGAAI